MRIILQLTAIAILLSSVADAQSDRGGGVTIASRPSGCTVYISGDVELVTTTPAIVNEDLRGIYTIRAMRPGYEKWVQRVTFASGSRQTLTIELVPKTRWKAAARSLVIPGWGQYYADEKTRSALWGIAAITTGVVAGVYESRYHDRKSGWEDGLDRFNRAETIDEKERLRDEVFTLQNRAYDAESDRQLAWGIVASVWAANLLDALVFFPEEKKYSGIPLTVRPASDGRGTLATFTFTF